METVNEEKFTFFWRGPLSQWYGSFFEADGFRYNCAEQYMMDKKAELFGDKETQRLIRLAEHPRDQKALGRVVKGFDITVWSRHAKSIVYQGNYHKFSSSSLLKDELLATMGTTLVEASPYDKIWGIGLPEEDPRCLSRSTWQGLNWLGETLTRLREDLYKARSSTN